ncbi:MAG: type II toxin-antitoxin system VapC family toxin [Planctomycetota bacterium]
MVLLETCTLLWLAADQKKLSANARQIIRDHAGELFVSSISAFEIAIKARKGKLDLPMAAGAWFEQAIEFHGIHEIPVTASIAVRSVALPPLHNDPCDRFIIATAMENAMPILTPDPLIGQYDSVQVLW